MIDKNEVHDNDLHEFLVEQINLSEQRLFSSYPDLSMTYKMLSENLTVPIDNLFIANGSDAIIKAIFENFLRNGDKVF